MDISTVTDFALELLLPLLTWLAISYLILRWLFRRWETRLAAERSFRLRFPLSSMVFLSRKIVIEELMNDAQIQAAITFEARKTGLAPQVLEKRLRQQAGELVPAFKAVFYFSIGYWLARTLLMTLYRVKLVTIPADEYEKIGRDATVVLVMNHRSNMDVLLVNFLLCRHSTVSHAAGEWARLWPLHHLVRLGGNYVVDRDSNSPLYRVLLKRYVQMAVARGIHLGIFPEGSLTRDGLIQPLNFGLLNYASTASWPGYDRDVVFIPVSFNYDQVPEQYRLVFEDSRAFKERGKLYVAYSGIKFCVKFLLTPLIPRRRRFGWACASFGEPVSLKAWQRSRGIELAAMSGEQRRKHIDSLGRQLMDSARNIMPVLPIHLLVMALLEEPQRRWPESDLVQRASELRLAMETAGAPLFSYEAEVTDAWPQALYRLERLGMLRRLAPSGEGEAQLQVVESQIPMLRYYANAVIHYLEPLYPGAAEVKPIPDAVTTGAGKRNYLRIMTESYDRVQHPQADRRGFFERFYEIFLAASPQVAEKFSHTDMQRLQQHLQQSLEHMVDFSINGKPSERIRQIARSHSEDGYGISSELYDLWLQSLIATIREYDPCFDSRVDLSWRALMAPGIAYMRSQSRYREEAAVDTDPETTVEEGGIACWIEHWGQRTPDKPALLTPTRRVSYAELAEEVNRLAAGLQHRIGIGIGDRVAFLGHNRLEFVTLTFACARLGAVLVPINFRLAEQEQRAFIERADAKAVFIENSYLSILEKGETGYRRVLLDQEQADHSGIHYQHLLAVPTRMKNNQGTMDSPLFIVFTSGSTGEPKGAVLTQGAVHWNALNSRVMHDLSRTDHILTTLPFFHVGGINIQTLPALQVGATVTILPQFDAAEFIQMVERDRPTLTILVPTQMQQLMQQPNWFSSDLSSLKAVATGSTMVNEELIQGWTNKGVPVLQIYGCTESGPIAIHQTVEDFSEGMGTVGYPSLYTEVRIIDPQGEPVPAGQEGEICLRGPHLMNHYWRDEAATREAFRNDWLLTGDLGYQDKDGRLRVVGRVKRLIISGGENIHPGEIELVLENHPDIQEAAVVAASDSTWGEVPVAVIVPAPGRSFDEQSVYRYLNERLGRYKHPRRLLQVAALPRSALGKIDYPRVGELVES